MGCLFVIVLGGLTAAAIYFIGYKAWVFIVLGILWIAALVVSLVKGHRGFGGGPRTDLQIVIAGAFIAAAIIIPRYNAQKPCYQLKDALRKLDIAEREYYKKYSTYTSDIGSLNMKRNPAVRVEILKGDMQSFAATASHPQCDENRDGRPDVIIWDSATGGPQ
jgi:hypothetical protein